MLTVKTCVLGAGAVVFGCAALLAIRELHRAAKRLSCCAHCGRSDSPLTKCIHCKIDGFCSQECHTAAFESHSKVCQKPSWEEVLALVRLNFKLQNYKGVVEWTHRAGELLHYADEEGRKVIQDMFDTSAEEVEKAWE